MPIDDDLIVVPMMGNVVQIPVADDKAFATLQIQRNTATEAEMDDMLQGLVDLIQGWEWRRPESNVVGQKYLTGYYDVMPTNPVEVVIVPPEDPPGGEPQPAP